MPNKEFPDLQMVGLFIPLKTSADLCFFKYIYGQISPKTNYARFKNRHPEVQILR